jgi:uncharacterized Zn finger protein
MDKHITNCSQCGSFEFTVVETLTWRGEIDDKGLLGCAHAENEIASIRCTDCGALYATKSFYDIYFN